MVERPLFEVLYEDPDLLAINKPAGLVCHPTKTDEYSSLIGRLRLYLGPGSHPQLLNRLDRETSGVTIVAKTPEAAREIRALWEKRAVKKEYLAIVHGHVVLDHGTIDAALGKDERSIVAIKDCVRPDGAGALTHYEVEQRFAAPSLGSRRPFTLVRVRPETGRKHQIRIHLSYIGHPIVGDKIYGVDEDCYLALVEDRLTNDQRASLILPYQALHAERVSFTWRDRDQAYRAEPEEWFRNFVIESPKAHPDLPS